MEPIEKESNEKLYVTKRKGEVGITTWDKIADTDDIFVKITRTRKGFIKKSDGAKRNALHVTNNQFYTTGYSGIGIILAQYMYLREQLKGSMPPLRGAGYQGQRSRVLAGFSVFRQSHQTG